MSCLEILMHDKNKTMYSNKNFAMKRENGRSPNGNNLNLKWVLRDNDGKFIDFDVCRHDLAERNALII